MNEEALKALLSGEKSGTKGSGDYKGFRMYDQAVEGSTRGAWICNISCAKGPEGEAYTKKLLDFMVAGGLIGSYEDQETESKRQVADVNNLDLAMAKLLEKK